MTAVARGPLRLSFVGDLTSIHVRKWIQFLCEQGHAVQVISSQYFDPARFPQAQVVNLAATPGKPTSQLLARAGLLKTAKNIRNGLNRRMPSDLVWQRAQREIDAIERVMVTELEELIIGSSNRVAAFVREFQPDVIQSLRLYPEGMLATATAGIAPWCLMAWGQDISLWAERYEQVAEHARRAVQSCSLFMADNMRDIKDARRYGLSDTTPWHITPSGGGVETERLKAHHRGNDAGDTSATFMTFRRIGGAFIDNLPIIRAIEVLRKKRGLDARFIIYGDQSGPYFEHVRIEAERDGVANAIFVRPPFPYAELAHVVSDHDLIVSAATFDGTTNALLETMWLGGIPLNGDLEPIREWITHGENGYVFPMEDPEQIASVFQRALDERHMHEEFRERNRKIILDRADYTTSMRRVEDAYYRLVH